MDVGPDQEPVQITNGFYDAGVLEGLGNGTHITDSVPGDWVTMHGKEFCILCSFLMLISGTTKSNELPLSMWLPTIALATDMAVSQSRCF